MTKKMAFVYFSVDDLVLNNVTLILGADLSIETHEILLTIDFEK